MPFSGRRTTSHSLLFLARDEQNITNSSCNSLFVANDDKDYYYYFVLFFLFFDERITFLLFCFASADGG
jgi:hypothetical protein